MKLQVMKFRKFSYIVSGTLILLSVLSLMFRGLNYGIDFSGGIAMEVKPIVQDYGIEQMRESLAEFKPELQTVDGDAILIRLGLPRGATDAAQNARVAQIKNILGDNVAYEQIQVVGPKIGGELVRGGILAILFAFVMMAIYVWIRYKGGYAVGAFVSLFLDFVLMFGFFSVTGLEFNQTAIAVILTGIGYSINDKIVNYDRIDENVKKYLIGNYDFNAKGEYVIPLIYSSISHAGDGILCVRNEKDKVGYIDYKGKTLIEPKYSNGYNFDKKGYAVVEIDGKHILIDKVGKELFKLKDEMKIVGECIDENLIPYCLDYESYGYLNLKGEKEIKLYDKGLSKSRDGFVNKLINLIYFNVCEKLFKKHSTSFKDVQV